MQPIHIHTFGAFDVPVNGNIKFTQPGDKRSLELKDPGTGRIPPMTLLASGGDSPEKILEEIQVWCEETNYRPARGFELASLGKLPLAPDERQKVQCAVAIGSKLDDQVVSLFGNDCTPRLIPVSELQSQSHMFAVVPNDQ